ncbi:unnamed protein product [Phytomonas sp. EM1]|nr:unnamed protein product [Phytomonas sp. EM1]|eukprot:CCW60322.1 unnamed protein product [Phytomonas sp. isolate EM1]
MPCLDSGCERCQISFQDDVDHFELVNNLQLLKKSLHVEHLVESAFLKENDIFLTHAYNRQQPASEVTSTRDSTKIAVEVDANEEANTSLDGSIPVNGMHYTCSNGVNQKTLSQSTTVSSEGNCLMENDENNLYLDDGAQGDYIPYNYEEEMEQCSEYIFSNQPYCPRMSRSNCSNSNVPTVADGARFSNHHVSAELPDTVSAYNRVYGMNGGLERHSSEYQKHANRHYHWIRNWLWVQNMQTQVSLTDEQSQHALRALLREACRRDILRLRALPAEKFINTSHPTQSQSSMGIFTPIEINPCTPTECKALYIRRVTEKWHSLANNVNRELGKGTPTRSLLALLSAQSLFCSDLNNIIRELEPRLVEDSKQQRRIRAQQLILELSEKGQLFVPPPTPERGPGSIVEPMQPPSPTWSGCKTPDDDTPAISSDDDGDYDDDNHNDSITTSIRHNNLL